MEQENIRKHDYICSNIKKCYSSWLSQKLMAVLFDCSTDDISLHLKNRFKENELNESSVTEKFSVTALMAKDFAESEFERYRIVQDHIK